MPKVCFASAPCLAAPGTAAAPAELNVRNVM
jgi:hypothetical protein